MARAGVLEGAPRQARADPHARRSPAHSAASFARASRGTSGRTSRPRPKTGASGGASFDDSVTVVRAAAAGQGFALVRWSLAYQPIRDGKLVLASPRIVKAPRSYYFVCPPSYISMEKIAAFREWLFEQAAQAPAAEPHFNRSCTASALKSADRRRADAALAHVGDQPVARFLVGERGRQIRGVRRHAQHQAVRRVDRGELPLPRRVTSLRSPRRMTISRRG